MGIVMLGIFAAAFGSEYTTGALRNLLVREPRRVQFLAGKYLALLVFGAVVILLASALSIVLALALAPGKGIDTSAWTSSTGLADTWRADLASGHRLAGLRHRRRGPRDHLPLARRRLGDRRGLAHRRREYPDRAMVQRPVLAARPAAEQPGQRRQLIGHPGPDRAHPRRLLGHHRHRHRPSCSPDEMSPHSRRFGPGKRGSAASRKTIGENPDMPPRNPGIHCVCTTNRTLIFPSPSRRRLPALEGNHVCKCGPLTTR